MEHTGERVYGFWDGDFTFHRVIYPNRGDDYLFRVRIDNENPEERARQNETNRNGAPPGWASIRSATPAEIRWWLAMFKGYFPLRPKAATEGLRHLRINGPTRSEHLPVKVAVALLGMTFPKLCIHDFRPTPKRFVEIVDDNFRLTDDGRWLTSLMK